MCAAACVGVELSLQIIMSRLHIALSHYVTINQRVSTAVLIKHTSSTSTSKLAIAIAVTAIILHHRKIYGVP